jgi:hypothetical protein
MGAKLLRCALASVVAGGVGLLLLAWRDRERVDLDDRLAALVTICSGLLFGVAWEVVEFILDWVLALHLQLSNLDTMTNLLSNDVGAVVAGALVVWAYEDVVSQSTRLRLGALAIFLVDGPSRELQRHGFAMTVVIAILTAAAVGALWFAGRPVPGFPTA